LKKLSVIGLGKLGACSAACFAYRGYDVIGLDLNEGFVEAVNKGNAPVTEPRLQELITDSGNRLRATSDHSEIIRDSDITFLIVPTPSREDGNFSIDFMSNALERLSEALKENGKPYHLFVITSTVSPGSTEDKLIPLIERVSRRKLNEGFGVCYNPEFIALGSVITNFLNPDMVLIGESDNFAGEQLEEVYRNVCENEPYIARMSLISGEITKISLNSYVTMKISYANTLANICENIPGADIDDISTALGADKRISPYYLRGGLGYGGPCFPRDNRAFSAFAAKYGVDAKLAKTTDEVNRFQVDHLVDLVMDNVNGKKDISVSILGAAYKPNTPVIEESPAIELINELLKKNIKVNVYDPLALDNVRAVYGNRISCSSTARECIENSSICVITTQAEEFKAIDESYFMNGCETVIDCWRILDPSRLGNRVKYRAIGMDGAKSDKNMTHIVETKKETVMNVS
jgi:UDPglucose 6-dehydrogenase